MIKFGSTYLKFGDTYLKDWTSESKYNPLNLPPYTIRLKYKNGVTPTPRKGTIVQVSSSPNVWDLTYTNNNWGYLCNFNTGDLLEVLGANSTGVTKMDYMFYFCKSLTSVTSFDTSKVTNMSYMFSTCDALTTVSLFDTSKVTNMLSMFYRCFSLKSIPLFDTSSVINMYYMFEDCWKVQSGALALYQQASSRANPPGHERTFNRCGRDTQTGAAELAQIPTSWGGTKPE